MNDLLFSKRKKVLSELSSNEYFGLVNHIGRIYNGDYDVVILMARKFSNLFWALLPLVKKEYFGRVETTHQRLGNRVPLIISDRALAHVIQDIRRNKENTKYKRILLSDDIIIHGTTMKRIKERLEQEFRSAGVVDYTIVLTAYAENMDGIVLKKEELDAEHVIECSQSSWRRVSSRIVDVLYIMGQPYTSYVPNARINMNSEIGEHVKKVIENLKGDHKLVMISDEAMKRKNVESYAMIETSGKSYKICDAFRLYVFKDCEEYVFVPMTQINPIDEDMLNSYLEIVKDCIDENTRAWFEEIFESCEGEYKYRIVLYILSALDGWRFWNKYIQMPLCQYEEREEEINFSHVFLQNCRLGITNEKIEIILEKIEDVYKTGKDRIDISSVATLYDDITTLNNVMAELVKNVTKRKAAGIEDIELEKKIVGKFLQNNGSLDEKKLESERAIHLADTRKRMTGLPMKMMISEMERCNSTIKEIYGAVLYAVDYGKGSIVPAVLEKDKAKIYTPVLHAGEQNFRYYLDNYFPIMYGQYLIEVHCKWDCQTECKKSLWNQYVEKYENSSPYFHEDKEQLFGIVMKDEYKEVLIDEALSRKDDDDLKWIITEVKNLIGNRMNVRGGQ